MKKNIALLITITSSLLLFACSTTKLSESWQDESFSRKGLNRVLIVAVTSNQTNRILFENEMAHNAEEAGIEAVISHRVLGDQLPDREAVENYVKQQQIPYILATKLEDVKVEKDYVPPSVRTYYTGPFYPSYGAYYGGYGMYGYGSTVTMTREAYVDTRATTILVTTIFDTHDGKPVWVGRSESFEPGSVSKLAGEIARQSWRNIH